ncbi:hypothetical protein [Sulfitobacter sp.]|uniref:hypothetical protein n=1 Tax=Sulfitobacter sp. TaxID=1903071 RepID=UPI0030029538
MPVVATVGIDPVWFSIYLTIVVDLAQITPLPGFNLFVHPRAGCELSDRLSRHRDLA